jgi:hypothetical protein
LRVAIVMLVPPGVTLVKVAESPLGRVRVSPTETGRSVQAVSATYMVARVAVAGTV